MVAVDGVEGFRIFTTGSEPNVSACSAPYLDSEVEILKYLSRALDLQVRMQIEAKYNKTRVI